MTALLLIGLLAGGEPGFWVERDGETLRLSVVLAGLFDAPLHRRLTSGLTTTLHLKVVVHEHASDDTRGVTWRMARARWDLWDETLTATLQTPDGAETRAFPTVEAFVAAFATFAAEPVATGVALDPTVYRVAVTLQVNPMTAERLAQARRWLTFDGAGSDPDLLSRSLFGSVLQLFDNLRAGEAERTLRAGGHPFRADRLPLHREPEE